ncbi:Arginyl-tRNA synthetase [Liberibacter crescens BT-1]|uniref:Arginine--tRNA ligase n=1 Tax=Liberibacter crescens (strain BT-1) TaxID=1215343 RepID=L0EVS1_LIBCB|nr:arginine--tRNA ligase [Liberibacter crescens]AGA64955.1 Arginyl-tRNA synthetase [Liberibacter crescens BT-1]AMC12976.1 arginyl-tRNA synthetase [Liberibacter crescens]
MHLFTDFSHRIKTYIESIDLVKKNIEKIDFKKIIVERPRNVEHGDLSTNAAMVLVRPLGLDYSSIAKMIIAEIEKDPDVVSVFVAGSGFINLRLSVDYLVRVLDSIILEGKDYGRLLIGKGRKVNIEYVSANPTGPMHVGHCRCAVVGDTFANLMEFSGYEVTREYYINDYGVQIDILARSTFLRYCQALGEDISIIPEGLYPGEYLVPLGEKLKDKFGAGLRSLSEEEWMPIVKEYAISSIMEIIKSDLEALNIRHDVFMSEQTLHQDDAVDIRTAINDLTFKGYVYKGILPPPKVKLSEDWESNREQVLFRSTVVGDDIDRPLIKSDGSYTYFAADLAYFKHKYKRGFDEMIYVLGSDHSGYIRRLEAVASAISEGNVKVIFLLCELVKLYRGGTLIKMSKRSGTFITLRDVVDEVGCDAVRFMMLWRKNSEPLDFDFLKVVEQSKDNPVFYVQYAYARCMSIFRQAKDVFPDIDLEPFNMQMSIKGHIYNSNELQIIIKLAEYPRVIENAINFQEPHRVVFYLYDLASIFHSYWNKGKEFPELRFVKEDDMMLTLSRLGLIYAVASILNSGLAITGIVAPNEM